jgi:hypothetical protein
LLTKFGLTEFAANFRGWDGKRRLASTVFDALLPHTNAVALSGPINTTTGHNALL